MRKNPAKARPYDTTNTQPAGISHVSLDVEVPLEFLRLRPRIADDSPLIQRLRNVHRALGRDVAESRCPFHICFFRKHGEERTTDTRRAQHGHAKRVLSKYLGFHG